jgi:hypothetical protein
VSDEVHRKLIDAINARAEAEKRHGPESKEFKAADALVGEIKRTLPKPMGGTGPRWK